MIFFTCLNKIILNYWWWLLLLCLILFLIIFLSGFNSHLNRFLIFILLFFFCENHSIETSIYFHSIEFRSFTLSIFTIWEFLLFSNLSEKLQAEIYSLNHQKKELFKRAFTNILHWIFLFSPFFSTIT